MLSEIIEREGDLFLWYTVAVVLKYFFDLSRYSGKARGVVLWIIARDIQELEPRYRQLSLDTQRWQPEGYSPLLL